MAKKTDLHSNFQVFKFFFSIFSSSGAKFEVKFGVRIKRSYPVPKIFTPFLEL